MHLYTDIILLLYTLLTFITFKCLFYFWFLLFVFSVCCIACPPLSSSALVVDQSQAVKFALDIASGMAFLHTLEPMVSRLYLNSKHIMVRHFSATLKLWYVNLHNHCYSRLKCLKSLNWLHMYWYTEQLLPIFSLFLTSNWTEFLWTLISFYTTIFLSLKYDIITGKMVFKNIVFSISVLSLTEKAQTPVHK